MHPLALEGLLADCAPELRDANVILHCNLLWLSSAERDLSLASDKPVDFNHQPLIPQLADIPAYKAGAADRLANVVNRTMGFRKLALHLRASAYDNLDLQTWTIEHPYDNPVRPVRLTVPACDRPGKPPLAMQPTDVPWVPLDRSLQWRAFQDTVRLLRRYGNRLLVVVGPYNEHQLTDASRKRYAAIRQGAVEWLRAEGVACCEASLPPASEFGDASHPLAGGYLGIAREVLAGPAYRAWTSADPPAR
jgi:hypothetical protein